MTAQERGWPRPQPTGKAMQGTYCVFNQTGESFVALSVRRADTALARLKGLIRQFRTKSDEGLWTVPARASHTLGLLEPVDVIYLDARNCVIHLVEHLNPFRIGPILWKSASVLQLRAHTIYSSQTHVGDQLLICPPDEMENWLKKTLPSFRTPEGDRTGAPDSKG